MVFKNDPTAVLELSSIKKQYGGVKALNDISISFPKGTITAIVGDNGAGKSTTLKLSLIHI